MKKRIISIAVAALVTVLILALLQPLVTLKYIDNPEGRLVGEYYAEAGGHDVIFVGDCEVYESFVPAVLWEKYGISSYIRGSAQQLAWHSYYLLEETFEYEKPSVVVFNVLALKYGEPQSEAYNRMTLDDMRWSKHKLDAINASMTEDERLIDYVFPLLRYHSRITQLEANDFKYIFRAPEAASHSGYLMQKGIAPMIEQQSPSTPLKMDEYDLPDTAMEYLEKMRVLCESNGAELVLIKAPTNTQKYWWYDEWDSDVREYAEKNNLVYYNFIDETEEIGIDYSTDTYDKGLHLNVYGAEKMTEYFGNILVKNHCLENASHTQAEATAWQERVRKYKEERNS